MMPSQIRQTPPLRTTENGNKDAHTDLDKRIIGAFGGCHWHPHGGKLAVTDVSAADVHTLVNIYKQIAQPHRGILEVFFHLDYEDEQVGVSCRRDKRAELTVIPKGGSPLAIRVPQWTPKESVRLYAGDKPLEYTLAGHFARTGKVAAQTKVTMEYDLPEHQNEETGLGAEYTISWRGDDVIGVHPNTDFYPFYPSAPVKA
jgi:hypothetical protein